jgi:hypothetical protein
MAYEHKPGDGSIFRNSRKDPNSKQPDYDGSFIDPVTKEKRRIALWIRDSSNGTKFFSVKVQTDERNNKQQEKPSATRTDTDDSDLPF